MPVVWVPGLMQDLTQGIDRVTVPGETVREVIDQLDSCFPGIKARLIDENRLRPSIAVIVDGEVSSQRMRHRLTEESEIHFLPAMSGG